MVDFFFVKEILYNIMFSKKVSVKETVGDTSETKFAPL